MSTAFGAADLDFSRPVVMKGESWDFSKYVETLQEEQVGSLNYLDSDEITWSVPSSLADKVQEDGTLIAFYGDTTVFELSKDEVSDVAKLADQLDPIRKFLADPLDPNQYHLTLHDLSNSPDENQVIDSMKSNRVKVDQVFKRVKSYLEKHPEHRKVKMISTNAFPCLNISILLGLAPKTEADFKRLINLYNLFDEVVYINFWLRPHITLSYFRPEVLNSDEISELSTVLKRINETTVELEFDLLDLAYQHFYNMNHYQTIKTVK